MRADIADVRLADRVFAPHYAAPLRRVAGAEVVVREGRRADTPVIATLLAGQAFDLFDITGNIGWGIAIDSGLVGYVDADKVASA